MSSLSQSSPTLVPQKTSIPGLFIAGHWCISGVGGEGGIAGVSALGRNAARLVVNSKGKNWPWALLILK
jgi:phytoene dehydrogenase-like protein